MSYLQKFKSPAFLNHATGKRMPNDAGWQDRHVEALYAPRGFERAIVGLITAWCAYADDHAKHHEAGIGDDGVLGPEWEAIGHAIRGLLNGEAGRLDCGTLDAFLHDTLNAEGFEV